MYAISSHVVYNKEGKDTYGPAHGVFEYLKKNNKPVVFIKHCLYGNNSSSIYSNDGAVSKESKSFGGSLVIRSIKEMIFNIKHAKGKEIYVGVDPLNGLTGVWLKLTKKTEKFIYLTPDYTENRFENKIINFIYHFIDKLCLKFCDEVWSVSSRIVAKRKKQGMPDRKNKLFPNSPEFESIPKREYDGNKNLIIVSHLSKSLNLKPVLEALSQLKEESPGIKLSVVGSGPEDEYFKKMASEINVDKNVEFLGQKNHDEVMELVSRSFLGFALYTLENSWNHYGDSMKAREYVACGVPVIINDIPSTADDVKKYEAGLVLHNVDSNEIYQFIKKCIDESLYYTTLKDNALKLGKDFDKNKILSELCPL